MNRIKTFRLLFILSLLAAFLSPSARSEAAPPRSPVRAPAAEVTAYDIILAMNTLRVSYGFQPLVEDPIVMAVSQGTAEIMAANQMSWHIGDVRGRIAAAGYGGGGTVWATENFAVGNMTIDDIMMVWADPDHMRPAVNGAYCNVGAGVAKSSNGMTYYILQAAYVSGKSCGAYTSPGGSSGSNPGGGSAVVPGIIMPVKVATPDGDGKIYHVVEMGQSFWAIAIAYGVTIHDIEVWNNISKDTKLQVGQKLLIPTNTAGMVTPTPFGMILPSTPDADGRIVHEVQAYQALITIAEAYHTSVDSLLALNGWQADWPLQIGQKLLISPGNVTLTPTPRPLSPIEMLTPAADGNYYHEVRSGETLSWIATRYETTVNALMSWNGLNDLSVIYPGDKLLLRVTPPATLTFTPAPPTATGTATRTQRPPTATRTPSPTAVPPTPTLEVAVEPEKVTPPSWSVFAALAVAGLILFGLISRRKG